MRHVGVAELKAHLSAYLAKAKEGEEIVVTDRGRPVARLLPPSWQNGEEEEARLRDLERRGILRRGTGKLPDDFWTMERREDPEGSVLAALLEERRDGW